LAVQAAAAAGADIIVKGLRTTNDFDIEQQMAHNNVALTGIRTVFVPCRPDLAYISSRFIREISSQGVSIDHMVVPAVSAALSTKRGEVNS
ncbi:MAG: phosphopantetheine adenylyltransferase, partial [Actinomycetota bacterium]|nr:phosphopantetheine adenylyltransferase [Actinomycetota bacterium]